MRKLLISLVFLAACQGSSDTSKTETASEKPDLVGAYLEIQTTLARDSVDGLPTLSAQVITAADGLSGPGVDAIVAGAGRTAAADIATARAGFKKMSYGLLAHINSTPALKDGNEVVFCPMAFNNDGAHWIQKQGEVTNPYHGKMMLHCGDRVSWEDAAKDPRAALE
ncbi:MAG: DUF3347 domain-containing protein [Myxococcales bacterium]|nr:DUF3347 domain-containing protein [Myxococcales bacterium]MCB9750306.1 DUF3347 domain-containing protein [Myxococcales bacterium]